VWLINDIDDVGRVVVMCCCSPGRIVGEGTELNGPTGLPTPHTHKRGSTMWRLLGVVVLSIRYIVHLLKLTACIQKKHIFCSVLEY